MYVCLHVLMCMHIYLNVCLYVCTVWIHVCLCSVCVSVCRHILVRMHSLLARSSWINFRVFFLFKCFLEMRVDQRNLCCQFCSNFSRALQSLLRIFVFKLHRRYNKENCFFTVKLIHKLNFFKPIISYRFINNVSNRVL